MNSPKEKVTVSWSMDDESWSHWAQGRGKQTASAVVLEGLHEIQKNPEAVKEIRLCCEHIRREEQESSDRDTRKPHKIEIQLPAADLGEACQLVGKLDGSDPVRPSQLLAAVILESKSWKQSDNDGGTFDSGFNEDSLISSIASSTELTHAKGISLGKQEKVIAWIVAAAAVANAVAAFLALCR